jgi:hypothetical protein
MGLKCAKCGFESEVNQLKLGFPFCNVCIKFAPNNPEDLDLTGHKNRVFYFS